MSKATLSFKLPEELAEFTTASKAQDLASIIYSLENELRSKLKYNSHPEWDEATIESIRQWIIEEKQFRGIVLE